LKIKQNNLIDLYRRLLNFITSNYPDALIVENDTNVVVTYPGELGRVIIFQDEGQKNLIVRILLDLGEKITPNNSKTFYLSTIDELNCLKTGIQIVMEMVKKESSTEIVKQAQIASHGQGYLLDQNKNTIGVVDLSLIPTNAFVRNTDIINKKTEKTIELEEKPTEKTIRKFFKR
jgi:hypothetical protein